MSTITFDTLKFVERLEKAGVSRDQLVYHSFCKFKKA